MKRFPLVLVILLFAAAAALVAQDVTVLKVKVQAANVRSEPDINAAVVRQVKMGTLLESRRKLGEWYEVAITDAQGAVQSGYINANVVDTVGAGAGGQAGAQQVEVKKPAEAPTIIVQQQVQQGQTATQTNVQTQTGYDEGRGGGGFKIMGGFGLANISDPDSQTLLDKYKQSKLGYAGGIGVSFGSRFGVEFDLMYLQKGVKFKGVYTEDPDSVDFDVSMNFNMISVPVLLRFNVLSQPAVYFLGGGEVAYILDGKTDYTYTMSTGEKETGSEKIEKDNLNEIDYGVVFGGGFGMNFGRMQLFVEGRYHLGLANLEKTPAGTEAEGTENAEPKTRLFLVMVGIKF
jgi:hypothetical protein